MLNKEKYASKLTEIALENGTVGLINGKPENCFNIACHQCDLDPSVCKKQRILWANNKENNETPLSVDWSQVAVDTPVLVKDSDSDDWTKAHFVVFKNNHVHTWCDAILKSWRYAKLDTDVPYICKLSKEEITTFKAGIETGDLEFAFDNPDWRKIYQKIIGSDKEITSIPYRPKYITKSGVLKYWDKRPIGIVFSDGTDVLAQENGYSLEECLDMENVKFFLD